MGQRYGGVQRFVAVVFLVLLSAPAVPASGLPADEAIAVLEEMNLRRRDHGLPPLAIDPQLALAASDRIRDLFARSYFAHVSPDGMSPFIWARYRGYEYRTIGENLGAGQKTARQVVDEWMLSPAHRANVLGSDYTDAGIAVAPGAPTRTSSGYTFVALYAARYDASPKKGISAGASQRASSDRSRGTPKRASR
jgi:uncharacterized protein YkwD